MTDFPLAGRTFAAVLLDMDGTLLDSIASVERSWTRLAGEYGFDPARLLDFHGVPARGVLAALLPEGDRDRAFARIEELEVGDTEGVVVLPGAAEALATLAAGGAHRAVVTSSTAPLLRARLAASGLAAPEVVVTADDVERGKPHPDPYLAAAERLGVDPADCLVVEDAVNGLRAGRAAGAATLAVGSTQTPEELAAEGLADAVVGTLADVRFTVDADTRRIAVTAR